ASSPALIEKVRSVVTDDQGNYKIVDLRPGTYTVTFTLPGFATYRREGIELSTGFTATANADMKVGALEETVTVTGASPVFDTQIGNGGGQSKNFFLNQAAIQEIVVTTAGASAEQPFSGVSINAVPKDGGNRFSTYFFTSDTGKSLQNDNLTDDLRARFVTS